MQHNRLRTLCQLVLLGVACGQPALGLASTSGVQPHATQPEPSVQSKAAPAGVQPSGTPAGSEAASGKQKAAAKKAVGALVNAIRFDKRALAAKYLSFAKMAEQLLGPTYGELTAAERSQFIADFQVLLVATAFPKGHELFAYLDGVLYGEAKLEGALVRLPSTIVVHRNLKKTELAVEWVLAADGDTLKVVDIVSMQESTISGIREEEVLPLIKEGGKAKLLAALHDKAQSAAKAGK